MIIICLINYSLMMVFKTKNNSMVLPKEKFLFDDPELHEKGCYWQ